MKIFQILALAGALAALSAPRAAGQIDFSTIYTFDGSEAFGLTAANGVLYSVGAEGNCSAIIALRPPATPGGEWTQATVYEFTGLNGGACGPEGPPAVAADGKMYGVASNGGAYRWGAVYELRPPGAPGGAWTERVLYSFPTITIPLGLIIGPDGALYVGCSDGGADGGGFLLKLQPPATAGGTWAGSVLFNFPGGLGLGGPTSLIAGPNGVFYGTIGFGGRAPMYAGAIFEIAPPAAPGGDWAETVLCHFHGSGDGSTPNSLTLASDGTLYGTTFGTADYDDRHGPYGVGTAFQLTPPASPGAHWTRTILAQLGVGDGRGPNSPLILRNGNLYGTTSSGASDPGGVVYELRPPASPGGAWTTTYLHSFDGTVPGFPLFMDGNGALYGTTQAPYSAPLRGTVYKIEP
jgi:hypothetical protein